MKKLLTIVAVAVSIGFGTFSFAETNVFGVNVPVSKNEPVNQVSGGYIESDHISFYLNPKDRVEIRSSENVKQKISAEKGYYVFGVKINV